MNSFQLTQEEITSLYRDWIVDPELVQNLETYYLLYWDRIYFNNYVPYFNPSTPVPRSFQHNGIRYSIHFFESCPGEWAKGEEQISRISLSFRGYVDSSGEKRGIVLVKAALYKEIV